MNGDGALRAVAAAAALFGGRSLAPWRLAATGVLLGVAVFGGAPRSLPDPSSAAAAGLALAALLGLVYERLWPAIVSEGALASLCLGLPVAAVASFTLRREGPGTMLEGAGAALLLVSLFGVLATLANSEAGWRRGAYLSAALAVPSLAGAAAVRLSDLLAPPRLVACLATAGILSWLVPALFERQRTRRELLEEVGLGFLPESDAEVLHRPWARRADPRFGRRDERKDYVKAALLLAVARQQQRRRSGEAIRLRQLEVLSFRTRMRRSLEVREERARRLAAAEMEEVDSR